MLKTVTVPWSCPALKNSSGQLFAEHFSVHLNGQPVQVRSCRESAIPFNRVWPGTQRPVDQTEMAAFVSFAADEPIHVTLNGGLNGDKAVVRPLSRRIIPQKTAPDRIEFVLNGPGQYVLECGNSHHAVYFFYNRIKAPADRQSVQWYFGPGIHFPGLIRLNSGDSVYIDPEAIVFGSLFGRDVHHIRIFGGGTLHGGMEERVFSSFFEDILHSTLKFYNSSDIRISDIIIQDSACFTTSFFGCSEVHIDHVKILGQWRYNTDGIDLCNTDNAEITDSFVRSFDDSIVMKGLDHAGLTTVNWQKGRSLTDIAVRNCVVWSGWGKSLDLGVETGAPEYTRITFENCDLIHNSAVCLDIQNGAYADIHDITFRNIRIEYQADTLPEIHQQSDNEVYDPGGRIGVPKLINIDNRHYGSWQGKSGSVHDILFENIQADAEPGVPLKLPFRLANYSDEAVLSRFTFRNITVNGKRIAGLDDVAYQTGGKIGDLFWE